MFKYIIKTMHNIDWMAILPLILFLAVFIGTIVEWRLKGKKTVDEMANIPLNDGSLPTGEKAK